MCGEQVMLLNLEKVEMGSPPRVRGTGIIKPHLRLAPRITPACAGNSWEEVWNRPCVWDHPRVCGEQVSSAACWHSRLGSPPRVRGTVSVLPSGKKCGRITPACAGNRHICSTFPLIIWDHPRVCGEQPDARLCRRDHYGSPPRVRGTGSA